MPDYFIRSGIRRMQKERIIWSKENGIFNVEKYHQDWVDKMKNSPIAYVPEKANEQHYEVPPAFFENVLGKHLKYSSGYCEQCSYTEFYKSQSSSTMAKIFDLYTN